MEQNQHSNRGRVTEWVFICILVAACLFGVTRLAVNNTAPVRQPLIPLTNGWNLPDGTAVHIEDMQHFDESGMLTIVRDSLPVLPDADTISTDAGIYRPEICINGASVYLFNDSAFPCNDQMRSKIHCDVSVDAHAVGSVSITYYGKPGASLFIPEILFGSSGAVLLHHIADEWFTIFIITAMLLVCLVSVSAAIYLNMTGTSDRRFTDMSCFLLLCSVWCACDSGLARFISHQSPVVEGIAFYAFMTLAIPLIQFIRNTADMGKNRSAKWIQNLFYANVLLQTALNCLGVRFIDMLPMTHLLLVGAIAVLVWQMHREYRKTGDRQLKTILFAFSLVGAAGILALLLYWLFSISFYSEIFETGLLAFVVVLVFTLVIHAVENYRFRTEAKIYERLSREDAMTGLLNRRGFDEWMLRYVSTRAEGENAALLFLDINGLKAVNDQLGHKAGDELVIGAAWCMRETFGAEGMIARLGGDEFCIVLPGVQDRYTEWIGKLTDEIARYNLNHRVQVSLAAGYSMLLDQNGIVKSQSDWKQQADQMMYQNKKQMKAYRVC